MARRVLEAEMCKKEGIEMKQLENPKKLTVLKEIPIHKTFRGVFSFQFNYTGELLAVGYGAEGIQLYEASTGKFLKDLRSCRQGGNAIMALRFHPKIPNLLYAASTQGVIMIIDVNTGELKTTIEERGNEINSLDFCVDAFNFATGGKDLDVRVYDTKTNKIVQHYEGSSRSKMNVSVSKDTVNNTMRIFAIKFHPDNQYIFVSGGWDNHLKIWDTRANDGIKRNIFGPHICGDALDMKDNTILSGQWTALHALQEYNYTDGRVMKEIKYPHSNGAFLYSAQYCGDDLAIAGGTGTNRAEMIKLSTNEPVVGFDLKAPVQAIDTAQNGHLVAVGGASSSFFILKVDD